MALATLRAGEGAGLVLTVLSIDGPVKWRPPRSVQGLFSFEFLSSITFCSRCKLLVYCSPICQLEHYNKTHKNHCKYLAGIKVFILNTNTCFVNANTNTTSRSSYLIQIPVLLTPTQIQHQGLDSDYSIFNTITTPASRSRRVPSTPRRTVPGYIFNLKAFHLHAQVHQYEKTPCWGADGSIVEYLSLHIWTGGTHGRGEKEQTDRWKAISSQLKRLDCSRIVSCQHQ